MKFKAQEMDFINSAIKLQAKIKAEMTFNNMKDVELKSKNTCSKQIYETVNHYSKEVL